MVKQLGIFYRKGLQNASSILQPLGCLREPGLVVAASPPQQAHQKCQSGGAAGAAGLTDQTKALRIGRIWYNSVRLDPAVKIRIIHPRAYRVKTAGAVEQLPGEAAVGGERRPALARLPVGQVAGATAGYLQTAKAAANDMLSLSKRCGSSSGMRSGEFVVLAQDKIAKRAGL